MTVLKMLFLFFVSDLGRFRIQGFGFLDLRFIVRDFMVLGLWVMNALTLGAWVLRLSIVVAAEMHKNCAACLTFTVSNPNPKS